MTDTLQRTEIPAEDGMYDVPDLLYHSDHRTLSASGAKLLLPPLCPAEFREAMDNPRPPTRAYDFGHLAHRMVLGAGAKLFVLDPAVHGVKKDGSPAASPAATDTWKQAAADARERGEVPVHVDQFTQAQAMEKTVREHDVAGPLFKRGHAEKSLYATDPKTGIRLRARPDWMTSYDFGDGRGERNVLIDYKTSTSVGVPHIEREFWKYMYFFQAAWYLHVVELLGYWDNPRFLFVVQKKSSPHLVRVVEYGDLEIADGRLLVREAIDLYANCLKSGQWPSNTEGISPICFPPYAVNDEMEISA